MKLLDSIECAKACLAHAAKAEKFLVVASPAYDLGGFDLAKNIKAKNVLMIYRINKCGEPDFSGRKFDALKAQAGLMEKNGISVKLVGRENLYGRFLITENCAVIGSLAFETPECLHWEFDDGRDIEQASLNPEGFFRERFEMGFIVYSNSKSSEEQRLYREACLLASSMLCFESMDNWDKYKRVAGDAEKAAAFLEEWEKGWNGVENALFADDSPKTK